MTDHPQPANRPIAFFRRVTKSRPVWLISGVITIALTVFGLLQFAEWIGARSEEQAKHVREGRRVRFLVPLLATKREYLQFMDMEEGHRSRFPENQFSRKVSRDVMYSIKAASQRWFSSRRANGGDLKDEQVDFYFFPEGYDEESYRAALHKALRESAADGTQVAAVIGNVTSTATIAYGKNCGEENVVVGTASNGSKITDPGKVPMILPLSTAANVPQTLRSYNVPAVLRLPPDNEKQTELISSFFLRATPKPILRVVVIKDLSNQAYSSDMLDSFRDHFVQIPLKDAQEVLTKIPDNNRSKTSSLLPWGNLLTVIPSGGEEGNPPIFPILEKLSPDAIAVFGMTNVSLETLAQIRVSKIKPTKLVLTDGAVDEYLLPRIANLMDRRGNTEIYLSFPLETSDPEPVRDVTKVLEEKDRKNLDMTHALYVIDGVFIALTLLEEGIFRDKDNTSAREIMARKMGSLYQRGSKDIGVEVPSKISYTFDSFGNSTNLDYHMFRMCSANIPGCPASKEPAWVRVEDIERGGKR